MIVTLSTHLFFTVHGVEIRSSATGGEAGF
jgi:hypothetical protein